MSCHVTSRHVMSCCHVVLTGSVRLCQVVSCNVMQCHVMSCNVNVTRSSSHPQSSDKTWIAPASHWILTLCPHQIKICTLHCCSKVCVLPLKTFHFGPANHQRIRCLSRLLRQVYIRMFTQPFWVFGAETSDSRLAARWIGTPSFIWQGGSFMNGLNGI